MDITAYQLQPLSNIIRAEDGETLGREREEREREGRGREVRVWTDEIKMKPVFLVPGLIQNPADDHSSGLT